LNFLFDTHCHINLPPLQENLDHILTDAYTEGIKKILVPSINFETSIEVVRISEKYPDFVYPAIGIHPNYSGSAEPEDISSLKTLISCHKIKAIGEIGLDFYRNYSPTDMQKSIFQKMLNIARGFRLPVCIHNRNADTEMINILDQWVENSFDMPKNTKIGILHAFDGSEMIADWAKNHHFLMGIGGPITYKNAEKLKIMIKSIDLEDIVLETDSPYLPPEPKRGQTNQPAFLRFIADVVAKTKGVSYDTVVGVTSLNAMKLLQL